MVRATGARGRCAASPAGAAIRSARGPAATPARPPSPGPATGPTAQVGAVRGSCCQGEQGEVGTGRESPPVRKAWGPCVPWQGEGSGGKRHADFQRHLFVVMVHC